MENFTQHLPMPAIRGGKGLTGLLLEGFRYFLGACAGLASDWAVWTVLFMATGEPIAAQAVSRTVGAVVAYWMFRKFCFRTGGRVGAQARRFIAAAAASWLLSVTVFTALSCLLSLLVRGAGFGAPHWLPLAAKIGSDGFTFAVNYFVMKFWVFVPESGGGADLAGADRQAA
jgi:putative flippase GtrA